MIFKFLINNRSYLAKDEKFILRDLFENVEASCC